jgi:hypothetical protein
MDADEVFRQPSACWSKTSVPVIRVFWEKSCLGLVADTPRKSSSLSAVNTYGAQFFLFYTLPVSRQQVTAVEIAILPRWRLGYLPRNCTCNCAYDRDVKLRSNKISCPGIEEGWGWDFPHLPRPGAALTTHPHLAPRIKKDYSYNSKSYPGPSCPVLGWTSPFTSISKRVAFGEKATVFCDYTDWFCLTYGWRTTLRDHEMTLRALSTANKTVYVH